MKRALPLLWLLLLLFAAGCRDMGADQYVSVKEHEAPYAYKQTETVPSTTEEAPAASPMRTVSRPSDIRRAIQEMVLNGEESGQLLVKDYVTSASVSEDVKNVYNDLLADSPKYTYAMESFRCDLRRTQPGLVVKVNMKLRLSREELDSIQTKMFPDPAKDDIYKALRQQLGVFIIQVSGYDQTDIRQMLEDYILLHPDQVPDAPGITVDIYPDFGNVRILEIHFTYYTDQNSLQDHKNQTNAFLSVVTGQLSNANTPQSALETLYMHLVPAIGYESQENATVYSQTVEKRGSSRTMASVAAYLLKKAGWNCQIVVGQRNEEPWYWNRVQGIDHWLYFDLHTAALEKQAPVLLPAEELAGYKWDPEAYPEMEIPVPDETEESDAPTEPEAATEPTEEAVTEPEPEPEQTEATGQGNA